MNITSFTYTHPKQITPNRQPLFAAKESNTVISEVKKVINPLKYGLELKKLNPTVRIHGNDVHVDDIYFQDPNSEWGICHELSDKAQERLLEKGIKTNVIDCTTKNHFWSNESGHTCLIGGETNQGPLFIDPSFKIATLFHNAITNRECINPRQTKIHGETGKNFKAYTPNDTGIYLSPLGYLKDVHHSNTRVPNALVYLGFKKDKGIIKPQLALQINKSSHNQFIQDGQYLPNSPLGRFMKKIKTQLGDLQSRMD